jgi:hypothetical protein
MSRQNLSDFTVEELRNELKKRGLKTSGSKAELISRLTSSYTILSESITKNEKPESKSSGPRRYGL